MATTIHDVLRFIRDTNLSAEDHEAIAYALNSRLRAKREEKKSQFNVGQRVKFLNSNNGTDVHGRIVKINRINIDIISDAGTRWRVSPTFLKPEQHT